MTGYADAAAAVEARFKALWVDGSGAPLTAAAYDNDDFTPPTAAPWVRLVVRTGAEGQKSFGQVGTSGSPLFRNVTGIIVQIFVPPGTGREWMWNLAETAAAVFRGQQIAAAADTNVTCRGVSIVYVGIDKDTGFFQMNATVDAFTDTLR